jgi:hypothetical protein
MFLILMLRSSVLYSYTWDTPLHDILGPEYRFVDEYRTAETTLKDILCHRTGLQGMFWPIVAGYVGNVTREDVCK